MANNKQQYFRVGNLVVHLQSVRAVGLRHLKHGDGALRNVFKPTLYVTYPRNTEVTSEFDTPEEAKKALDDLTVALIPPPPTVDGQ